MASIVSYLERGEALHQILSFKDRISKFTPEAVKRTAQKYLQISYLLEAVHLPEKSTPRKYKQKEKREAAY
jgi:predicted Zn-dependent peptidase